MSIIMSYILHVISCISLYVLYFVLYIVEYNNLKAPGLSGTDDLTAAEAW